MPEKNTNTSALYAVAGAADAAVTALRDLPARAPALAQRAETLTSQLRERLAELPTDMQKRR